MGFFGKALNATANGLTGGISGGISSAVEGMIGLIGQGKRQKKQLEMQKKLNEQVAQLNYEYGEKAAENGIS